MNNPPNPLHEDQSATASDCTESTSSQSPLKCLRLLAKDMMEHSSAAAVTVSNTVNTELIAYFADCKNYSENIGLKFCVTNANHCWLHLPRTCCQLLHLRHTWNVCSQSVES